VTAIQLPGVAVVGAVASWIFLDETLGAAHGAAVVLLVGGAALLAGAPPATRKASAA
jgi:drug/metabolite transporter (DMT)-like permease